MKTIIFFLLALCAQAACAQQKFSWLIGTWKLEGKELYEIWSDQNDGTTLKGISFKVNNADTLVLERIQLQKLDDAYYYIPDVAENRVPVKFKIVSNDAESFTAENSLHDFPKMIKYTIVRKVNSVLLEASISGNGKVIPYTFLRIK